MKEGRASNLGCEGYGSRSTSLRYVAILPSASAPDGAGAALWRHDIFCKRYCCPGSCGQPRRREQQREDWR
jgi:hypothetical protein